VTPPGQAAAGRGGHAGDVAAAGRFASHRPAGVDAANRVARAAGAGDAQLQLRRLDVRRADRASTMLLPITEFRHRVLRGQRVGAFEIGMRGASTVPSTLTRESASAR
jgi:hypothetical protein